MARDDETKKSARPKNVRMPAPDPRSRVNSVKRSASAGTGTRKRPRLGNITPEKAVSGKAASRPVTKTPMQTKKTKSGDASVVVTTAISVLLLIVLIWLIASLFFRTMNKKAIEKGVLPQTQSMTQTSNEHKKEAAPADRSFTQASSSAPAPESQIEKVQPRTEGPAEYSNPDSWVGKSFAVEDRANVRSGAGTDAGILGSAVPGEIFTVKEAVMGSDVTWVHGTLQKSDGSTLEGWMYSPTLLTVPQ